MIYEYVSEWVGWKCPVGQFGVSLSDTLDFYELYMIEVSLLS